MTAQETFTAAMQSHQAGDQAAAARLFRGVLAFKSNHDQAHYMLGVIALQTGQFEHAIEFLRRAIAANPSQPDYYLNLGAALDSLGQIDEAISVYKKALSLQSDCIQAVSNLGNALRRTKRVNEGVAVLRRALALQPTFAEAHHNLGLALQDAGDLDGAIAALGQAILLRPGSAPWLHSLGTALHNARRFSEAVAVYRQALAIQPIDPEIWTNLASALIETGEYAAAVTACRQALSMRPDWAAAHTILGKAMQEHGELENAINAHRRAISIQPDFADAHNNLGAALYARKDWDGAKDSHRMAIALRPEFAEAHNNLGAVYQAQSNYSGARRCYQQAIALRPQNAEAYNNLGSALKHLGKYPEAIASMMQALALRPDYAAAHWNLGLCQLMLGDFDRGWQGYEWRGRAKELGEPPLTFPQPRWDGTPLNGARILLHAEQGIGDFIQFVRYTSLVADRGGTVLVGCPADLGELICDRDRVGLVDLVGPRPDFAVHCPLMSLPLILKTSPATIPANIPYLRASPAKTESWRARLAGRDGPRVGLAWAGNPKHANDRTRSMPPAWLAPLAGVGSVHFVSLQKGWVKEPPPIELLDWTGELSDFTETAGLIANLDLVISVDTAVAHLAGAMGKPVWLLLPHVAEWRWMLDREDSPWYPTMRLFRQASEGDWQGVVERLVHALGDVGQRPASGVAKHSTGA